MTIKIPQRFVGLHAHSLSIGDSIDYPNVHIDYAIENGMDAALTDHGHMCGISHQIIHAEKLKKKGVNFKPIYGIEAYYVDSLQKWKELYDQDKLNKLEEKKLKTASKKIKTLEDLTDQFKDDKEEFAAIDENIEGGLIVEDEDTSKKQNNKWQNPINQRNHLILLAKNQEGLKTLFKLCSQGYINGYFRYPRIDLEMLKKHANGNIIGLQACIAGRLAKTVFDHQIVNNFDDWQPNNDNFDLVQKELKDLSQGFQDALGKENYFLELQFNKLGAQHLVNQHFIQLSKDTNIPLVATCDSHYGNPSHWREREIYKLISWSSKTKDSIDISKIPEIIDDLKCELYPKNAQQMWDTYKQTTKDKNWDFYNDKIICEAIERSYDIAHDHIDKNFSIDSKVKLPVLEKLISPDRLEKYTSELKDNENDDNIAFRELKRLCIAGLQYRKKEKNQEYIDRLKEELSVMKDLNYANYFITYNKIIEIVRTRMLTGPGRGSAASSLIAWLLNITQIDPIKNGLLFERFAVRNKKGFADIDSDVPDRTLALELLTKYFGEENVVAISNFNQLQLRSLIKDIGKMLSIPFEEMNSYTKFIEVEARATAEKEPGFDASQWTLDDEEAISNSPTFRKMLEKYPEFEKIIKVLFKQQKNTSRHAGGILITDNAYDNMPIIKSGGVIQTPWSEGLNYRHLEYFGFLKFDILGIGTLRIMEKTIEKILRKQTGKKNISFKEIEQWYYDNVHPDNNNMDDLHVYQNVYWKKNFAGTFQFVQDNVQEFISKMKPVSINDIAACTSIFRPGPLGSSMDKIYLKNRSNPDSIQYKHPLQKEVLGDEMGCLIYQEQLMQMYHKLTGVPLEETDAIRKAFTKKDLSNRQKAQEDRDNLKKTFIEKCKEVNDIPENISHEIFTDMEKYVSYLFNKSHAISYATISYQCAHFLTYHTEEWISSYIDYCINDKGKAANGEDPKQIALKEAKSLGFNMGNADINYSTHEYDCIDNTLIPSVVSLKYVGATVLEELNRFRPYKTIEDLLWHKETPTSEETWRHSKINKRSFSSLIKVESFGSMDIVGPGKLFNNYKHMHCVIVDHADDLKKAINKKKNKNHKELLYQLIEQYKDTPEWTREERFKHKLEIAGFYDDSLIVTQKMKDLFVKNNILPVESWSSKDDLYWGIIQTAIIKKTSTGKDYLRLTIKSQDNTVYNCSIWNYKADPEKPIKQNCVIIASFKKDNYGMSTFQNKMKLIS